MQSSKIDLIVGHSRRGLSAIKLKRTDTTLDLSQKAKRAKEEKKSEGVGKWRDYIEPFSPTRLGCCLLEIDSYPLKPRISVANMNQHGRVLCR